MITKTLSVLLGLAAGLLFAELLLRFLPTKFCDNLERSRYIASRNIMHLEFCEPDPDPLIGWHNIPGKQGIFRNLEFQTHLRFNRLGLRGPQISEQPTPNRRRILVLGDSMTVGWGVEEAETFIEVMNRARKDWEVLNLGVSGFGTRSEWGLLRRLGPKLRPSDIVLAFYLNDPEESYVRSVLNPAPSPKSSSRWQRLYLLALWEEWRQGSGRTQEEKPYYHKTDRAHEKAAAYFLHKIHEWSLLHKATLHVIYIPAKDELREVSPVGYRAGLAGFCRKENIDFLDITPYFQELRPYFKPYFKRDDHMTPLGHRIVAQTLL
ncbi:MAG: SGNH/GDSL hydrolase family protein, partial [Elusimicrobia bacterium]|nr:SGNH/GDSL hydrolase family protein [Elusimicrobiota bacterium]